MQSPQRRDLRLTSFSPFLDGLLGNAAREKKTARLTAMLDSPLNGLDYIRAQALQTGTTTQGLTKFPVLFVFRNVR